MESWTLRCPLHCHSCHSCHLSCHSSLAPPLHPPASRHAPQQFTQHKPLVCLHNTQYGMYLVLPVRHTAWSTLHIPIWLLGLSRERPPLTAGPSSPNAPCLLLPLTCALCTSCLPSALRLRLRLRHTRFRRCHAVPQPSCQSCWRTLRHHAASLVSNMALGYCVLCVDVQGTAARPGRVTTKASVSFISHATTRCTRSTRHTRYPSFQPRFGTRSAAHTHYTVHSTGLLHSRYRLQGRAGPPAQSPPQSAPGHTHGSPARAIASPILPQPGYGALPPPPPPAQAKVACGCRSRHVAP